MKKILLAIAIFASTATLANDSTYVKEGVRTEKYTSYNHTLDEAVLTKLSTDVALSYLQETENYDAEDLRNFKVRVKGNKRKGYRVKVRVTYNIHAHVIIK